MITSYLSIVGGALRLAPPFFLFCFPSFCAALEVNDHAMYQAATTVLDVEQKTLLMEIMRIANEAAASASAPPAAGAHGP